MAPPSEERSSAERSASTRAYTVFGSEGATARPMRPSVPAGIPSASVYRRHVSPPSWLTWSPDPGPPEVKNHGSRRYSHIPAYSFMGLDGSMTRSLTPVRSLAQRTRRQVAPPSVVL